MNTDKFALYDGAYVLGALSPTDRLEYEDHLRGCAACASSITDLAGLPGLMSRVSPEELTTAAEAPPETLLPSLARAVRRGRRRRAAGFAAATAASLIVVGAVAVSGPDSPARQPIAPAASAWPTTSTGTANLALRAVVPSPVTASARLVDVAWGTRIELTCSYSASSGDQDYDPAGDPAGASPYALVVVDRSGAAQQIATWSALPGRELTVHGASSLARGDIAAVEIRTLSGRAILRLST